MKTALIAGITGQDGSCLTEFLLNNYESPRRGETFVTRNITRAVGRIKLGSAPRVSFEELTKLMLEHDFDLARQERVLREAGHQVKQRRG